MNGLVDKASPLKLECQFTDGELSSRTRVLEGCCLHAEGGTCSGEHSTSKVLDKNPNATSSVL